jgi:alpha-L-fucosidase
MTTKLLVLSLMIIAGAKAGNCAEAPAMLPVAKGPFQPSWESLASYQCPEWFRDAKFGIWAHWSAQCVPEQGDWYARKMYMEGNSRYKYHVAHYGDPAKVGFKDIDHLWRAEKWDPERLISLYKRAGARYFVALANHHDNFDCYDSRYQPWNSVNIGPKRDIVGDWAKAARAAGLRFGITVHAARAWTWFEVAQAYDGKLAQADGRGTWWDGYDPQDLYAQNHWPGDKPHAAYCRKFYNRTIDLIDKYRPDLLYFDDGVLPLGDVDPQYGLRIAAHLYNASIQQHGQNEAVMNTKGLREPQRKCLVLDIERRRSGRIEPLPWQTDTCIGGWHYASACFKNHSYKRPQEIVHLLADIVSKNGNLLLNIPVRGDGTIDADEVACLEGIAGWMAVNGEAIYATRPWKVFGEGPASDGSHELLEKKQPVSYTAQDIRFTRSKDGNTVFAIVLGLPQKPMRIKSLATAKVSSITLLGGEEKLRWRQEANALEIQPARSWPCQYAVAFKIALEE